VEQARIDEVARAEGVHTVLMHSITALAEAHRPPEANTRAVNAFLNYTNLGNCHYGTILSLSWLEYSC